jgi:hypothetical protein
MTRKIQFSKSRLAAVSRQAWRVSLVVVGGIIAVPALVFAHGGMGPNEIAPPVVTSGLIGFACYWLVMLWPSSRKGTTEVRSGTQNKPVTQTRGRSSQHATHVKRKPRLRKIEGSGRFGGDQNTRRKASDG